MMTPQSVSLEQVGVQTINSVRVPVFALPSGRYVEQPKAEGLNGMISVDAAKMLKNGQFPLVHTISASAVRDEVPLALRDEVASKQAARRAIRALMDRLIEVQVPTKVSEN